MNGAQLWKDFLVQWSKIPLYGKLIGLIVLNGGIFAAYFYMSYSPQMEIIASKKNEINGLERKVSENLVVLKNLEEFKQQIKNLEQLLEQALALLPRDRDIGEFLRTLSINSDKAGVRIVKFSPLPESPRGFYSEIPVGLSLTGSYHDVANYFDRLGKQSRIVNVNKINMGAPMVCNEKAMLDITCTVTTFRFITADTALTAGEGQPSTDQEPARKRTRRRPRG